MQDIQLTPTTVLLLIAIAAWVIWAVRRLFRKGMCDCTDHCEGCSKGASGKKGCSSCTVAEDMVKHLKQKSLQQK